MISILWTLFLVLEINCFLKKNKEPLQTLYLMHHSHIDPGWRKTLSAYFYGDNYEVDFKGGRDTRGGVRSIYHSILSELEIDPQKTFVIGEIAYFKMYYDHSTEHQRSLYRKLIEDGRIEFAGGGYVMPDEACTYYDDLIDENMIGHEYLRKKFNVRPTTSWQLDNFGFSAGYIQLCYDMGFKVLYMSRVDYWDKHAREKRNAVDFIFAPTQKYRDTPIFSHILYFYYMQPHGYWYDLNCGDSENHEPIRDIDDPIININSNIEERAQNLVGYFRHWQSRYNSSKLVQLLGNDFTLTSNGQAYENYDRLFEHIRAKQNKYQVAIENILPFQYFEQHVWKNRMNNSYEIKSGDFFQFRNGHGEFWSGYYTSRPNFKYICKTSSQYMNQVRNIIGPVYLNSKELNKDGLYLLENKKEVLESILGLEETVSLMQHHDAITGTTYDLAILEYIDIMMRGIAGVHKHIDKHFQQLATKQIAEQQLQFVICQNNNTVNISCPLIEQKQRNNQPVLLNIYNQFNYKTKHLIRLKVENENSVIIDTNNEELEMQDVMCLQLVQGNECDLYFVAELQPLAANYFKIVVVKNRYRRMNYQIYTKRSMQNQEVMKFPSQTQFLIYKNDMISYTYKYCIDKSYQSNRCYNLAFKLLHGTYRAWQSEDNNKNDNRNHNSGSYVFHASGNKSYDFIVPVETVYQEGRLVNKVYTRNNDGNVQTVLSFYNEEVVNIADNVMDWKQIEVENIVGSMNTSKHGKELTMRIVQDNVIDANDTFYTDRNGLELQMRTRNKRDDYQVGGADGKDTDIVGMNFYPVTSIVQMINHKTNWKFSVVVDRSIAIGQVHNKTLDFLLQRQHNQNDGKGIAQPLVEKDRSGNVITYRSHMTMIYQLSKNESMYHRDLQYLRDSQPLVLVSATNSSRFIEMQEHRLQDVIQNSHKILTDSRYLRVSYLPRPDETVFVRLFNNHELSKVMLEHSYDYIQELSIQGSWTIEELNKLHDKFDYQQYQLRANHTLKSDYEVRQQQKSVKYGEIKLLPFQIRTFLVGDDINEFTKYNQTKDEPAPEYQQYYSQE